MAHLMKFHLLQWEIIKVKFLINSNMTLTVLNLHQKKDPGHYDKVKGQIRVGVKYIEMYLSTSTSTLLIFKYKYKYESFFPQIT